MKRWTGVLPQKLAISPLMMRYGSSRILPMPTRTRLECSVGQYECGDVMDAIRPRQDWTAATNAYIRDPGNMRQDGRRIGEDGVMTATQDPVDSRSMKPEASADVDCGLSSRRVAGVSSSYEGSQPHEHIPIVPPSPTKRHIEDCGAGHGRFHGTLSLERRDSDGGRRRHDTRMY